MHTCSFDMLANAEICRRDETWKCAFPFYLGGASNESLPRVAAPSNHFGCTVNTGGVTIPVPLARARGRHVGCGFVDGMTTQTGESRRRRSAPTAAIDNATREPSMAFGECRFSASWHRRGCARGLSAASGDSRSAAFRPVYQNFRYLTTTRT